MTKTTTTKTKTKKLLKSQRELLMNRQNELAQSQNNIMKELDRRGAEIIQNLLQGYGAELGLDFENETWEYNGKEMAFVKVEPEKSKEEKEEKVVND